MTLNEKQQIVLDTFINKRICFVNASAGTGKTTTLIQSYIALLEKGDRVESIVVITFTKAAANEMLIRIRSEVRKKIKEESATEKKEYWNNVYNSILTSSNITTIHAYAQKIVSENALYLGIPSAINILEEDDDFIENIYHIIEKLIEKSESGRIIYSLYNLYMIEKRRDFIENILNFISSIKPRLENIEIFENKIYSSINKEDNCNELIKELNNCDINFCINYNNPTSNAKIEMSKPILSKLKNSLNEIINGSIEDIDSIKMLYNSAHNLCSFSLGNVKADFKEEYNKIKSLTKKLKIALEPLCFKREINAFTCFVKEAYSKIEHVKKQSGIYTHDDIISIAISALENEDIASRIRECVSSLILDEAQDTSSLQFHFINLLIFGKKNISENDINNIGDKRLFIVGDRKQSIYRFRDANIEQFLDIEEKLKNYSTVLRDNYRSNKNLINFFNNFFQNFVFSNDQIKYNENDNLIPDDKKSNEKSIKFLALNKNTRDGDKIRAEEVRNLEANAIASYIENNLKNEYRDTTILLRGFSNIHVYLDALSKYNIDFYVEGGRGFFKREEIRDIMSFLYYLFLFEIDSLDLLLTFPFFDISIDDLFMFKSVLNKDSLKINDYISIHKANTIAGIKALSIAQTMPFFTKLEKIKEVINSLEKIVYSSKIEDVIETICTSTNYYSYIATKVDAEMCLSNIDKLCMIAKNYEHSTGKTAYDFVSHVKRQDDKSTPLSQVAKLDIDSLRIMTIHKSKGLEFKNTFFASVGSSTSNNKPKFYFIDDKPVINLPVSKTDEIIFPYPNKDEIKMKEESEKRRLLYVALTRASDKLIISGEGNKSSYRGAFDNFFDLTDFMENNITSLSEETLGVSRCDNFDKNDAADICIYGRGINLDKKKNEITNKIEIKEIDILDEKTDNNALRKKIKVNLASGKTSKQIEYLYNLDSLIDSKAAFSDDGYENINENTSESEDKNIKLSPADVGSVIHSILENFDFEYYKMNGDKYINILTEESVLNFNGYDKSYIKNIIIQSINNYLKDPHIVNIINGEEEIIMREHSFQKSYKDNDGNINIMKGKIDLITKDKNNNYYIIDYKVSTKTNNNESNYKKQLDIYRELVCNSCNIDTNKTTTYLMYLK